MSNTHTYIPTYFLSKRNVYVQILFTAAFAYVFINIYKPFGADKWYDIAHWEFLMYSGLLVIGGMLVVVLSRILMYYYQKKNRVPVMSFLLVVGLELSLMSSEFACYEKYLLHDTRPFPELFFNALQNTALILLIPYSISLLFFALEDKNFRLENLKGIGGQVFQSPENAFIPFYDENNILRITLKSSDIVYLESSENYVIIHYVDNERPKQFIIRSTIKKLEEALKQYSFLRCHRSYIVNTKKIKMVKRGKRGGVEIKLDGPESVELKVTKTFQDQFLKEIHYNNSTSFQEILNKA